jgi:ATP-dependent Clp protease ATP-binding subunit ClpB
MNRIDKSVVFHTLQPEHLKQILEIELDLMQQRILQPESNNGFLIKVTSPVKEFLLKEGTDLKYGARHLKRAIERHIVFPLATLVSTAQIKQGDCVCIDQGPSGALTFFKTDEGKPVRAKSATFRPGLDYTCLAPGL